MQRNRLAGNRRRAETASRKLRIAPLPRRSLASPVAEVLVESAERAQRFQQDFLILLRHRIVERALFRGFGQELGDAAVVIGLDVADALRLAAKGVGGVEDRRCG